MMTTARTVYVAISAFAALSVLSVALPANALPTDQYLALRRSSNWDRSLTYAQVEGNIHTFANKVLELRGSVNGTLRRENNLAFLLTFEDKRAILLNAPAADTRLVSEANNQSVRVLAKVSEGVVGNVVPLEVLGVALDGELTLKEREAERREALLQAQRQAAARRTSNPPVQFASRGGYYTRPIQGGGGTDPLPAGARTLTPDAQAIFPIYRSYILKCNTRLTNSQLDDITYAILYYSKHNRVDPRLVVSLIIAESDFDPRSTSHAGAMGLGQIMPDEARDHGVSNPYNIIENIRTSINLLRMKLNIYSDGGPDGYPTERQIQLALAAYNAGAGAVKKYGGIPPYKETQNYVKKIMRIYKELCS